MKQLPILYWIIKNKLLNSKEGQPIRAKTRALISLPFTRGHHGNQIIPDPLECQQGKSLLTNITCDLSFRSYPPIQVNMLKMYKKSNKYPNLVWRKRRFQILKGVIFNCFWIPIWFGYIYIDLNKKMAGNFGRLLTF